MKRFKKIFPIDRATEKLNDALLNVKSNGFLDKAKLRANDKIRNFKTWLHTYRQRIVVGLGAISLIVVTGYAGTQYVSANMNDIYQVYYNDQFVGEVSSPKIVDQVIADKLNELDEQHPKVNWEIERQPIGIKQEKVFKGEGDDERTAEALRTVLEAKAVGVQVVVDGKAVAVVKDEETANRVLERLKETFAASKPPSGLTVLSADAIPARDDDVIAEGTPEILSTRIIEPIELLQREIQPNDVMDEHEVYEMLLNGDAKPTHYIVQKGDTPSQIAEKLGVPIELLYSNNQDHKDLIERDLIRIGDKLDLTMIQPAVTVETVEKLTETIAVHYETIYEEDETMRKGQTKTVREGKNGVKKVTYLLTKVNGLLMEEQITGEAMLEEPIPAVVKRGTKVVKGEGTGKFSWPVVSAKVSSGYGKRWGRQHKGIDLTSSKKSILAADHGKVVLAGKNGDYGNTVIIDHNNGYKTLYAHLSKIEVKKGDVVEKGDKIGVMGNTGRSTGVHLHFEVIVNGANKNPMSYLRK